MVRKGKRQRQRKWTLLFRREDGRAVYLYEPLKKGELQNKLRNGWKQIQ